MKKTYFVILLFIFLINNLGFSQFNFTLESGTVWNGYNDVQASNNDNDINTRFSLTDDFEPEQPAVFIRGQVSYLINQKHRIELTAVPLTFKYESGNEGNAVAVFENSPSM